MCLNRETRCATCCVRSVCALSFREAYALQGVLEHPISILYFRDMSNDSRSTNPASLQYLLMCRFCTNLRTSTYLCWSVMFYTLGVFLIAAICLIGDDKKGKVPSISIVFVHRFEGKGTCKYVSGFNFCVAEWDSRRWTCYGSHYATNHPFWCGCIWT